MCLFVKRNVNTIIILFLVICISNLGFTIYLLINLDSNHFLDRYVSGFWKVRCAMLRNVFSSIFIYTIQVNMYLLYFRVWIKSVFRALNATQHWDVLRQIWWSNIILTYTYTYGADCRSVIHISSYHNSQDWILNTYMSAWDVIFLLISPSTLDFTTVQCIV